MKGNQHKKMVFQDNFIKHWCCSAKNHPEGWRWWKKKNRKKTRQKLKKELRDESNEQRNNALWRKNNNINYNPTGLYLNTEGATNIEGIKGISREDRTCYEELFCEARDCGECDFYEEDEE